MGGEQAPDYILKAANMFLKSHPDVYFLGYGNENLILDKLASFPKLKDNMSITHTEIVITDEDKPSSILRTNKKSSMALAIEAVKTGEASAVVSGGNTGALMAYSKFSLRTLSGIDRPAICSLIPTIKNTKVVILDLGANIDCNNENLVQFAIMGNALAKVVLGLDSPKISLLNVGREEVKGSDTVKSAANELRTNDYNINFCGYIEAHEITKGNTDVVVTDGFSGNVALKSTEGMANLYKFFLKKATKHSILAKIGFFLARRSLKLTFNNLDSRLYNGAVFLGINGIVVKSHGSSDYLGFHSALKLAYNSAFHDMNEKIIQKISYSDNLDESKTIKLSETPKKDEKTKTDSDSNKNFNIRET